MSDLELERSATAPHRWIELCNAFEKQHLNDLGEVTPRAARNIDLNSLIGAPKIDHNHRHTQLFLVPGGRYLVTSSRNSISVLDLGCTSLENAAECCKLIASVGLRAYDRICIVQATPDGMGLTIFLSES